MAERRNGMSLREAIRRNARAQQQQQQHSDIEIFAPRGNGASRAPASASAGPLAMARAYRVARQSGQLNISSRGLTAFPMEILRLFELVEEDEKSWECVPLVKVDLSYNEIAVLPEEIHQLPELTSFKMRHNKLHSLPNGFFELSALTALDLSNNELEGTLPDAFGKLVSLRELGLERNKLTSLPEAICQLQWLEILRLDENVLENLPNNFGHLERLHTLSANSNRLSSLPPSFSRLANIVTLDLKKNALVSLGDALHGLSRLLILDLRENKLQEFPILPESSCPLDQLLLGYNQITNVDTESISRVASSLTVLDLRDNKLQQISGQIVRLYRLKTLDLCNNSLGDLPPALGYLKDLNHLLIEGNPMRSIRRAALSSGTQALKKFLRTRGAPPTGIPNLLEQEQDEIETVSMDVDDQVEVKPTQTAQDDLSQQHEYLYRDAAASGTLQLTNMRLSVLPDPLNASSKYRFGETLIQLNVSKNRLVELTGVIGQLSSLQTLVAEECMLERIHSSIAMLPRLQHLRVRKNALSAEAIDSMLAFEERAHIGHTLKELDLRNNYLLTMPKRCRFLATVDTLLLSNNRIQTVDGFPWSSMHRLAVLSLADNKLESLGTVHQVPSLTSLSVENNNLRQIPPELAMCEHLRTIYITGNPQRSIRLNIVNEGSDAILKYLRNKLPVGNGASTLQASTPVKTHIRMRSPVPQQSVASGYNPAPALVSNISFPNGQHPSPNPAEHKRARRTSGISSSAHVDLQQPVFESEPQTPGSAVQSTPLVAPIQSEAPVVDAKLQEMDMRIKTLEAQLDDFALSQAKRYAVKKELAMVRSQRIRHVRSMAQAA
ncbi:hypothetical protein PINS_up001485 [Pythium insidiosum]|nr:hypothetical protein PINS_up001485 [Pythium insidiosum]